MNSLEKYVIEDNDELIRRVIKKPSHYKDGRVTSASFKTKPDEDGLSVNILEFTDLKIFIINPDEYLAAKILAGDAVKEGCKCVHDPKPTNFGHALILGITKQIARKLAQTCQILQ